jgi:hypothetical protein
MREIDFDDPIRLAEFGDLRSGGSIVGTASMWPTIFDFGLEV